MATKHELILRYISGLGVGSRISVRGLAKKHAVSEGTAYRAIKDAEASGLVSTVERVGTIRIEQRPQHFVESLTFRMLVKLVKGRVLGGAAGLTKELDKFVIGAMTPDEMLRYITPNSLMIVGNREDVQRLALNNSAAVLITGGFATSDAVIALANERELPILQTEYDTYSVATIINRALSDQAIKQDIQTVAGIYLPLSDIQVAHPDDTVADFVRWRADRSDFALPVATTSGRLVGVVTSRAVLRKKLTTPLERVMDKDPVTVRPYLSVTAVGHTMQENGLALLPVVDDAWQLLGIVTRSRVFASLAAQGTEKLGTTIADSIGGQLKSAPHQPAVGAAFTLHTTPMMTNRLGTLSFGVMSEAINTAVTRYLNHEGRRNVLVESFGLHGFRPVPLESTVEVTVVPLELLRRTGTFQITLKADGLLIASGMASCQLIERTTQ